MPAEWRARTDLTPAEYEALLRWIFKNYGNVAIPPNDASIFQSPYYQYWKAADMPGFEAATALAPEEEAGISEQGFQDWLAGGGQPDTGEDFTIPPEPMSEYQRAQTELAQRELEWRMGQTGQGAQWRPGELERLQAQDVRAEQERLAALQASPRDWIQRWFAGQPQPKTVGMPGSYITEMQRWGPRGGRTPAERRFLIDAWQAGRFGTSPTQPLETAQEMPVLNPATGRTEYTQAPIAGEEWLAGQASAPQFSRETGQMEAQQGISEELRDQIEMDILKERKSARKERDKARQQPQTPPAPGWLPQFAPGQVAGQPITPGPVKTPSGQLWARTPWSQRQGLAGFADFAGGEPLADIMDRMAMMQPVRPEQRPKWRPARSR